ncbi:MAG TPA: FtsX-like permease family protein [Candidatus Limnocylindria bacterium]|nr:FtsX-like permease family protein [Candidatus Limnocylindria bacterium]
MTFASFIAKNALRNKRRASLTILSVAISCALLVTLLTLQRELTIPPESEAASLRIIARNKVSLWQPLPAKQLATIEKIPGVVASSPFTYFGGNFRDETVTSFAQFAVDPVRFKDLIVEGRIAEGAYEDFIRDRTSCFVGIDTMKRYGLKLGDRMHFTGAIYPVDLDLKIVAVYAGTVDDRGVFFHHKLLDELMGNPGTVGTWYLRVASAAVSNDVINRVNKAFENTSAEVRAETERGFQMSFISMLGNVKVLFRSISAVVVFTLMLVTVSTMSMAIRERFRELAVLKALGFRRTELFSFILAESFGLATLGALVGIGGAWAFWTFIDLQKLTKGFLPYFEVTPRTMATGAIVAALLGIASAIAPSLAVARTSVVEGLKTLD